MINTQRVNEVLCTIAGISTEEAESYSVLVQNSARVVERALIDSSLEDDERIIFLAAARAYYSISLTAKGGGGVSSFSAGDVKISMTSQYSSSDDALKLYRSAKEAVSGLVDDDGFVFRGV